MSHKRKRNSGQEVHDNRPKRSKSSYDDESNISEVSDDKSPMIRVMKPPSKSGMNLGRTLTFPMKQDSPDLPRYEGPQMQPFRRKTVEVKFVREIGTNARHSNVFEVLIESKLYALKLFRTFTRSYGPDSDHWVGEGRRATEDEIWQYYKPFHCECRAYARMNERGITDRFWKCYGYVRLPPELRQQLYDITGLPAWYWQVRAQPEDRDDKPTTTFVDHLSWPIYGLVKELAPAHAPAVDPKARSISLMRGDLKALHKANIANYDIGDRNYLAGRLVDFSHSLTLPHIYVTPPGFKSLNGRTTTLKPRQLIDVMAWREMIVDSGVKTRVVQAPQENCVRDRLRGYRQRRLARNSYVEPLYMLGFKEPTPPREDTPDSMYA